MPSSALYALLSLIYRRHFTQALVTNALLGLIYRRRFTQALVTNALLGLINRWRFTQALIRGTDKPITSYSQAGQETTTAIME